MDKKEHPRDDSTNRNVNKEETKLQASATKHRKLASLITQAEKEAESNQKLTPLIFNEQLFTSNLELDLPDNKEDLFQNPDLAYKLYYKMYRALAKRFIPVGKVYQPIRNEINLYLKRGKTSGADSRQANTKDLKKVVLELEKWSRDYNGQQLSELYRRFLVLNNPKAEHYREKDFMVIFN